MSRLIKNISKKIGLSPGALVLLEKSKLDYAKNYEVTGDCKNKNLHEKLLNKQEVYEIIKTILLE